MNNESTQGNWSDVKAKIKTRWSKFNDSELETFNGHLDKMTAQIQKTYGITKEQAEKEYNEFNLKLQSSDSSKNSTNSTAPSTSQSSSMVSEGGNGSIKKIV